MGVVALLGYAAGEITPAMLVTPSGLKYRVPLIVVTRSKLVSLQSGQTQWPLRKTFSNFPVIGFLAQVVPLGQTTLISNSVLACTACSLTASTNVPRMNLWKTRT